MQISELETTLNRVHRELETAKKGRLVTVVEALQTSTEFPEINNVVMYACVNDYYNTARSFVDFAKSKPQFSQVSIFIAELLQPGTLHAYAHVVRK